jgi:hypothetical protein
MISMLRPPRGVRCSQDLDVGVLGEELSSVLDNGSNSYQIYPGAPLRLSQIDEHRDGSHPRSALSQSMSPREQHVCCHGIGGVRSAKRAYFGQS